MCGLKCLGFFTIYIIIEYLLIQILMCLFLQHSALFFIAKLTLLFSMGVSIVIIIIGFGILILCCKKISSTYFCVTIQFCEMFIFLLEIEHSYYELLIATPLIFLFLQLLVYYGAKKLEIPEEEQGGFQLEFVSISRVINHMTCYKFKCSHWWKIYLKKNPLQDLLSSLNAVISTNESTEFITGHVVYNLAYVYKFQLKTTII